MTRHDLSPRKFSKRCGNSRIDADWSVVQMENVSQNINGLKENAIIPLNYSPPFRQPFPIDNVSVLQSRAVRFYKLDRVLFPLCVASTRKLRAIDMLRITHHHLERHAQLSGDLLML
jgi:hypothetical protein